MRYPPVTLLISALFTAFSHPLLFGLLLSFSLPAPAQIEQFSVAQCAQLEAALELNREQQRRGYKLKQELKIKAQQAQLELQMQYHCQQPLDVTTPQRRRAKADRKTPRPAVQASNQAKSQTKIQASTRGKNPSDAGMTISVISVKAPFQGAKQLAWLNYYQPPFYCFGVRHTERIRQCVEQRQQAQQRFDKQYSERHPSQPNNLSDQ
ncbi:hypothetical protein [Rheinheimera texasensis]|uniref:hypothetical protein n=1 Tax=Rheinheimera texasensis TaxID=306205 RepID=UPI0032B16B15